MSADAEGTRLATLDVLAQRSVTRDLHRDLSAQQADGSRTGSLVLDLRDVHFRHDVEQRAGEVRLRALAGRSHHELARIGAGELDQLGHRLYGARRVGVQ